MDESGGRRPRVLIVEDEFLIADDLERALVQIGGAVVGPVGTCEEALALLDREIDFAIVDIDLHGHKSFPVADALTARGVPFVFATGYDRTALPERFASVRRWEKPFEPSALIEGVGKMLGRG